MTQYVLIECQIGIGKLIRYVLRQIDSDDKISWMPVDIGLQTDIVCHRVPNRYWMSNKYCMLNSLGYLVGIGYETGIVCEIGIVCLVGIGYQTGIVYRKALYAK